MRSRKHNYNDLDGLTWERDSVPWYFRLAALVVSWMVLGGYFIFSAGYENDAQLRFAPSVLYVFVVALLIAGYSMGVLLCFLCQSIVFQAESIFLPTLASSALGLLGLLWKFISCSGYIWNAAAVVSLVLSLLACGAYGFLYYVWHKKLERLRSTQRHTRDFQSPVPSVPATDFNTPQPTPLPVESLNAPSIDESRSQSQSEEPSKWQTDSYYLNYNANMHPSAFNKSKTTPALSEDELVNQQMAMLLARSDSMPTPPAGRNNTFRIDLPENNSDGATLQRSETLDDYFNHQGAHTIGHPQQAHELATSAHTIRNPGKTAWDRMERAHTRTKSDTPIQPGLEPVRPGARPGIVRAKSREERQKEIEMGSIARQR